MRAIIAAAGQGSRLASAHEGSPKTLLRLGGETILARIMAAFRAAGVGEFIVVVGCRGEMIADYLARHGNLGHTVQLVENPEWERGNGLSVLRAGALVAEGEDVLLSMSDHLVSLPALRAMAGAPSGRNLLLVDSRIHAVPDLEDATKVRLEGRRIREIGKDLALYNAIDCGVFRLTGRFFQALAAQIALGREGISDGARALIARDDFDALPIPPGSHWVDVDTPETYQYARENLALFA